VNRRWKNWYQIDDDEETKGADATVARVWLMSTVYDGRMTWHNVVLTSLPGWLLIFLLLTPLTPNSCSLDCTVLGLAIVLFSYSAFGCKSAWLNQLSVDPKFSRFGTTPLQLVTEGRTDRHAMTANTALA